MVTHVTDGPYVIYDKDFIKIIYVNKNGETLEQIYKQPDKERSVNCNSATTHHKFTFKLKTKHDIEAFKYKGVNSVFALSDIEGNFESFTNLLIAHKITTPDLSWNFKEGHLVILGDIFDREEDVLACLWLIYKLEIEAEAVNGKVHLVLGNHEAMSLSGDFRYTREKYTKLADKLKLSYNELFNKNTELGIWLRTKHSAVLINKNLYVHAGISKQICKNNLSIEQINQIIRIYLGRKKENFPLIKDDAKLLFGRFGPLWYRGYFLSRSEYNVIEEEDFNAILQHYNVNKIIVGHTTFNKIEPKFNNKLLAIDIFKPKSPKIKEALFIDNKTYYRATENGNKIFLFKE